LLPPTTPQPAPPRLDACWLFRSGSREAA
jgi:hypothetical protein